MLVGLPAHDRSQPENTTMVDIIKPDDRDLFWKEEREFFDRLPRLTVEQALRQAIESSHQGWRKARELDAELRREKRRNADVRVKATLAALLAGLALCFAALVFFGLRMSY